MLGFHGALGNWTLSRKPLLDVSHFTGPGTGLDGEDSAVESPTIHVNDFQGAAGSDTPSPSTSLLHLPPQTPSPWPSPRDPTQAITCRVLTPEPSRQPASYIFLSCRPWRMQGLALSHGYLCSSFYPLPASQGSMCLSSSHVWVYKGKDSPGTLSDTVNLDILHRRYQSCFYLP